MSVDLDVDAGSAVGLYDSFSSEGLEEEDPLHLYRT